MHYCRGTLRCNASIKYRLQYDMSRYIRMSRDDDWAYSFEQFRRDPASDRGAIHVGIPSLGRRYRLRMNQAATNRSINNKEFIVYTSCTGRVSLKPRILGCSVTTSFLSVSRPLICTAEIGDSGERFLFLVFVLAGDVKRLPISSCTN